MPTVFADSGYFIALLNPRDKLRSAAIEAAMRLGDHRQVTSEMVLAEVLAFFSGSGAGARAAAVELARRLRASANSEIVPQSSDLFRRALDLYAARADKQWSLVDCASILIMEERGLAEALAADHHFEQAGFAVLIKVPAP